ncbi:NADAR family protein [Oerskovia sp. NPDC060338]|uniref:NADAR family protein n=1 Tax=Oerskovia sp. NPDC060338 TaxID=3347100 RepID=UPI00364F7EFD
MPAPTSVEELLDAERSGTRLKYVTFWGHAPRPDGRPSAACFSQWWDSPFTVDGVIYPTAEHWMMAGKARLFGDEAALEQVLAAASPGAAKAVGRSVHGFDDEVWEAARFELVVQGTVHKFSAHPELLAFLLGTGDRVLVEASPRDRVWGIGLAAGDERAQHPASWLGLNLLGFALMVARDRLRG